MGKIALQRVVRCRAVISLIREVKICTALNKENTVFCCAENAVGRLGKPYRTKTKCCTRQNRRVQLFVFTLEFSLKPTTAFSAQQKTVFSLFNAVQILTSRISDITALQRTTRCRAILPILMRSCSYLLLKTTSVHCYSDINSATAFLISSP